jgi:sigma-B regulation protein RsbU (phosphoserine phosphatase)
LLFRDLSAVDMFITVQVLHVDGATRRVRVANAGHCPALLASQQGGRALPLAPEGLPLGVLDEVDFSDQEAELAPGTRLLVYTDGLVETRNPAGDLYGYERLGEWLTSSTRRGSTVQRMKQELIAEMTRFQRHSVLQDDQTFLVLAG